jgi:transposase
MMSEAAKVGPATTALFEAIMKAKPHPEQGFRSCLGIISLVKSYGPARVEAACQRGKRHRCDHLWFDRVDPQEWSRQSLRRARGLRPRDDQRRCVPSRQYPRA